MPIQKLMSSESVNFKGNQVSNKDNNTTQPQNNIKNGKKKLVLALAAIGAAAVAGIAIYKGREKKLSNAAFDKVSETVNNDKTVEKTVNEAATELNVIKAQQEVKGTQEKLNNVINPKPVEVVEEATAKTTETTNEAAQKTKEAVETAIPETEKAAEATGETMQKAAPEVTAQTVSKYSGNIDERLAAIKNKYAEIIEDVTPEELEAIKILKPEILEQIDDYTLATVLSGDIEKITTTLNDISPETIKALNEIGITGDVANALGNAGKAPTAETILENARLEAEGFGKKFNPADIDIDKELQIATARYEEPFKKVKLLDEIFTPDGIRGVKNYRLAIIILRNWLKDVNYINTPGLKHSLDRYFKCFNTYGLLKPEFSGENLISKINQAAEKL